MTLTATLTGRIILYTVKRTTVPSGTHAYHAVNRKSRCFVRHGRGGIPYNQQQTCRGTRKSFKTETGERCSTVRTQKRRAGGGVVCLKRGHRAASATGTGATGWRPGPAEDDAVIWPSPFLLCASDPGTCWPLCGRPTRGRVCARYAIMYSRLGESTIRFFDSSS